MGKFFSQPNSALLDPTSGRTSFIGDPSDVVQQFKERTAERNRQILQGRQTFGDQGAPAEAQTPISQIGTPSFREAAQQGAMPGGANVFSPGLNKAGKLATLLMSGLQGAMAGRAASEQAVMHSGGRRSGGVGMGFEAATLLPWQRTMRQQEMERGQAQTELLQAQSQMVPTPYGPMPAGLAKVIFPAQIGAQAKTEAAKTIAGGRTEAAQIGARAKLDAIGLQTAIATHKGAKFLPDVDPETKQPFYHVLNPFGQEIGRSEVNAIPSLMTKTSSTVDYKQLDDGSIVALPKTTVSKPVIGKPGVGPTGAGAQGAGNRGIVAPPPVRDAQGNPIVGKGAITSTTRTMVETAPKVTDLVERIKGQIAELQQSGDLGPGASRWNEFWSGKVGTDNPKFRALQANTTLLSTLLMRMHMGARGGQQIMEHFDQMIGAGHQSAANMLATMEQIGTYANDVRGAAPLPANYGKGGKQQGLQPTGGLTNFHINPQTGERIGWDGKQWQPAPQQ